MDQGLKSDRKSFLEALRTEPTLSGVGAGKDPSGKGHQSQTTRMRPVQTHRGRERASSVQETAYTKAGKGARGRAEEPQAKGAWCGEQNGRWVAKGSPTGSGQHPGHAKSRQATANPGDF